jgi:hypothetical protein
MILANKRTRCGYCKGWIEKGDEILFEDFRWHGRTDRLPIHPLHDPEWVRQREMLHEFVQLALERSARDRVSTFTFQEAALLPDDESDSWVI